MNIVVLLFVMNQCYNFLEADTILSFCLKNINPHAPKISVHELRKLSNPEYSKLVTGNYSI